MILPIKFADIPISLMELAIKDGILFSNRCIYAAYYLDGRIIGIAAVRIFNKFAILKCLFVLLDYRGNGIGTKLINWQISEVRANNIQLAYANCTPASCLLYERAGGRKINEYKNGISKISFVL